MVQKMTVAELKSYLRLRDLKMRGKKSKLLAPVLQPSKINYK